MIPQGVAVPLCFVVNGTPTSAQWQITGWSGILQAWTPVPSGALSTPGQINLTVPSQLNVIQATVTLDNDDDDTDNNTDVSDGGATANPSNDPTNISAGLNVVPATREARIVEVMVTIPGQAPVVLTQDYTIVANTQLVLMQNTFATYAEACEFAGEIANLQGWFASDASARYPALMTAYDRLSRLNYEIYYDRDDIYFRNRASWGLPFINTIGRLYSYSPSDFQALDPDFQMKIKRAQVIEADYILQGDPLYDQRADGVISSTVGNTSMMFRSVKPLQMSVCKRALKEMAGYLKYNFRLIRS